MNYKGNKMPFINVKLNVQESEEVEEKVVSIILNNTSNIKNKKKEVTTILVEFLPTYGSRYIQSKML